MTLSFTHSYPLPPIPPQALRAARGWVWLAIGALAVAGLLALGLALARAPQLAHFAWLQHFFHVALVVHVDLSVLVWFLAVPCMCWRVLAMRYPSRFALPYLGEAAFYAFFAGTVLLAASAFHPDGEKLMSNYIPVITNGVFFLGLGLISAGVALALLQLFTTPIAALEGKNTPELHPENVVTLGLVSAGVITFVALAAFAWSHALMPQEATGEALYEQVFWAGGHILQFTHTQMAMLCWLGLAAAIGIKLPLPPKVLVGLWLLGVMVALGSVIAFLRFDITEYYFQYFFTLQMAFFGGLAPGIVLLGLLAALWHHGAPARDSRAYYATLLSSIALFGMGGAISLFIDGQNVKIPAHYHGSIVGVSLAFMGAMYVWLPQFGARAVGHWRSAYWQPIIYGFGQIMHIGALAYSGGYDVLRKTPGGEGLAMNVKIALGFVGLGGLISIIGGFLFVWVMWQAFRKPAKI